MNGYVFANGAEREAAQRFGGLETVYDPATTRALAATGVGPGWRCWEVGGGGGSIAAWLAQRVGPAGRVLVTDLDPRFLAALPALQRPQVTVRCHDVGREPPPAGAFDLIHARLVLIHVPTREAALGRLVGALKPGGWLVVEDFDPAFVAPEERAFPATSREDAALYARVFGALARVLAAKGVGSGWGRGLYRRFREYGLVEVGLEGALGARPGGSAGAKVDQANLTQLRAALLVTGIVTAEDLDRMIALLDDPDFAYAGPVMFTAWGRKPCPPAAAGSTARPVLGDALWGAEGAPHLHCDQWQ